MNTSEPARRALYNRLEEVLGDQNAETLMTSLPLHPTSDLATRSDVDRLDRRVDRLEQKVDRLSEEMRSGFAEVFKTLHEQQTTYSKLTIGAMTALTAIFSLIVALIT